jgi:hypothetical protein
MATYQRIFSASDVAQVHRLFLEAMRAARIADQQLAHRGLRARNRATYAELQRAYQAYNNELAALARKTAAGADAKMRAKLKARQVRPDTRMSPHLSRMIRSRPIRVAAGIESGAVGIADENWLDKAVNPTSPGYGTYWRAQEYGTGQPDPLTGYTVPSQVGRVIYGYFYGPGLTSPERPQSQYAGGGGPHPIFVAGNNQRGPRGGKGGRGVISVEIQGKHFLRDGANEALLEWRAGMANIEQATIGRLKAILP